MLLLNARAVGGFGPPSSPFSANRNIVAVGDSITFGFGASSSASTYHALAATYFGTSDSNQGHNGAGWTTGTNGATQLSDYAATDVDPLLNAANPQTLILFAGTNDFYLGVTDANTVFNAFLSYRAARIAAGWDASRILVPTMLPRNGLETMRTAYNSLIVSNASTYGYSVARFDLDARIGAAGANNSPTYYYDDTHPNDAGHAVMAGIVESVMA